MKMDSFGGTELIALGVICKTAKTPGHRKNTGYLVRCPIFFCPPPTPAFPRLAVGQHAENDEPKCVSNLKGIWNKAAYFVCRKQNEWGQVL